jgi:hypothetical protein
MIVGNDEERILKKVTVAKFEVSSHYLTAKTEKDNKNHVKCAYLLATGSEPERNI